MDMHVPLVSWQGEENGLKQNNPLDVGSEINSSARFFKSYII